ncbi:MAG: helix-turn-helix domain-containing protein [Lachnospiraceae bacterium]|nr:helix-turn-helix domain-containing protein [Lachnospiraceae bacterium]
MDTVRFGKFIRDMRKEKGMTQKQLADLLYVSDKAVSKWENGACFPDIKMLDQLAEQLGVSILELMQSERIEEPVVDRTDAELAVRETISQSEKAEEQKRKMGKAKILLSASACGILYLIWAGIRYLAGQRGSPPPQEAVAASLSGAWYESPVLFYIWAGILSALCGAAAFLILWKSEQISEVKIGRHKIKSLLTILMDILVVLLLHTCLSNIANNEEQLKKLPEAVPVNGYITTMDGSWQTGIFIPDRMVQGLLDSEYVEDLHLNVRLKAGLDPVLPGQWKQLNLYLAGANRLEAAVRGLEESDVVWNAGEDSSFLQENQEKCIVSKELFEKHGWKLGDRITLYQYYYYRKDEKSTELFMDPLQTTVFEIAGYMDLEKKSSADDVNVRPDILIPFSMVREAYEQQELPFYADSASFHLSDALKLNEFKQDMKELGLKEMSPLSDDHTQNGTALIVNDAAFIDAANHLRQVIDAVRVFFPFLLALIVCVGYLVTLLLLNSRKKEAALLRSIGIGRWRCFRIFFMEQLVLVVSGVVLGSVLSVLLQGNYGADSVLSGCLVCVFYMLGNSLAIWKILKVSVMEALMKF